jgi:sporulation protein YlmC with PRC-barrel domain
MSMAEVHIERLLGRRVRSADGKVVGRLEEFRVDMIDGEPCVTEFHIGGAALIERITGFASELPLLRSLPFVRTEYRVRWQDVDLSDPRNPRLSLRYAELEPVRRDVPERP